jgi:hypothetical protein
MFFRREPRGIIRVELGDGRRLAYEGGAAEVLRLFREYEGAHGHSGVITITRRDLESGAVEVASFRNLITNAGKNLDRDGYAGSVTDRTIKYCALGTGTSAPAGGDVALGAEASRFAITSYAPGSTGVLVTTANVAPNEAVGTVIGELGWFAGAAATSAAGSGVLVARVLYSHTKTASEALSIQRTDTYS